MARVQCKGCEYKPSEHDTLEGYCMICASKRIRENVKLKERTKDLEAENKQYNENLFRPVTFHRCSDGKIQTYPSILCSRSPNCRDDFKAVERIKELEEELGCHYWIPVSKRLPEDVATVFILTGEGAGGIGFYSDNKWERLDHAINLNITYWKPIIALKG